MFFFITAKQTLIWQKELKRGVVNLFIYLFIHLFIYLFIYSFIYLMAAQNF